MTAKEFLLAIPDQVQAESIEGMSTLFHFDIDGEGLSVKVENGIVDVTEGFKGDPKCIVKSTNDNFMGIVNGEVNPTIAVLTGKVKINNPSELIKYAKSLGIV